MAASTPKPGPQPPPAADQAWGPHKRAPAPEAKPEPEKALPKVETPRAPRTMQDFVKVVPPPTPQEVVPPMPKQVSPAPPPPPSRQALKPSPLAPESASPDNDNSSSSGFVNPADTYTKTRVKDDYLWAVIRKFSQYLPNLRQQGQGGTVRLRFVIARDGRLLEASIAQSSGVIALDRGLLEAIKAAAPYPPLPPEIPGPSATFTQDIQARQ